MSMLIEKILEAMQLRAEITVDFLDSFVGDKYTSYRKMRRSLKYGPKQFKSNWADAYRRRRQFSSLLSQLRKDGLVKNTRKEGKYFWRITSEGVNWLNRIKKSHNSEFSRFNSYYPQLHGGGLTIVTFDIPEKERKKRGWISSCLSNMGLSRLQKSVWVGKGALDEKFIYALRKRGMLTYIHIFSVGGRGTISEFK